MTIESLLDWVVTINEAGTFKEVCRAFEKAIEPLGVRYYGAGPLTLAPVSAMFAASEAPDRWVDHYTKSGLAERDPLLRAAREGRAFKWDEVQPADEGEDSALREILTSGMSEGFATSVQGPGALKAGVTMAGALSTWALQERVQAKILGDAMLDRSLQLNDLSWRSAMPILAPIERKILSLAANGKVDKEIAIVLKMQPGRVHERWRRIRTKLGAKDRANATAIAVAIGLIQPPSRAVELVFGDEQLH